MAQDKQLPTIEKFNAKFDKKFGGKEIDFSCISPYFVRDEEFMMDEDCMCIMLYDEDMQPLSDRQVTEFSEALNNAVLDYCYDKPFKVEGNTLYAKDFVPIPIGDDTLEYSVMHILYMASLKAERFKYNGIAVLAIEGMKHEQQYTVWHCLCVKNGNSCGAEAWMNSHRAKEGNTIYVNDNGEQVGINEIALLLEVEMGTEDNAILDDMLKKVLREATSL